MEAAANRANRASRRSRASRGRGHARIRAAASAERCPCDAATLVLSAGGGACLGAGLLVTSAAVFASPELVALDRWQSSLLGLLLICSGCMAMVKASLRITAVLMPDMAVITEVLSDSEARVPRNPSVVTLPPSYDTLNISDSPSIRSSLNEAPPPDYDEAVLLITDEKLRAFMDENGKTENETKNVECKSIVPK